VKFNARQLSKFLETPDPSVSAVLLFGPDQGLVSETSSKLVSQIAGRPADPFLFDELTPAQLKSEPTALMDAALAMPMMGGRKAVLVRQATDSLAGRFDDLLGGPAFDNLIVVEAGELAARSRLRKVFEKAGNAAAAGCYGDDSRGLETVLREVLAAHGMTADPDVAGELAGRLGNDRMVSRGEIEKLVLYVGDGGRVSSDDVARVIGDNVSLSVDAVVFDTADGNSEHSDQALNRAFAEGVPPIQILRALQRHFQRLHWVAGHLDQGARLDSAVAKLKPPVFFKFKARFQRQAGQWNTARLDRAMELLLEAERQCKQTGAPAEAICQRTVLRLAGAARRQ